MSKWKNQLSVAYYIPFYFSKCIFCPCSLHLLLAVHYFSKKWKWLMGASEGHSETRGNPWSGSSGQEKPLAPLRSIAIYHKVGCGAAKLYSLIYIYINIYIYKFLNLYNLYRILVFTCHPYLSPKQITYIQPCFTRESPL